MGFKVEINDIDNCYVDLLLVSFVSNLHSLSISYVVGSWI